MADGYVQVPADGGGKKIDTSELIRPDATTVERERVEIPGTVTIDADSLDTILIELRVIAFVLATTLGFNEDLDSIRDDFSKDTTRKD